MNKVMLAMSKKRKWMVIAQIGTGNMCSAFLALSIQDEV
jgi:hypothetical protein